MIPTNQSYSNNPRFSYFSIALILVCNDCAALVPNEWERIEIHEEFHRKLDVLTSYAVRRQ